MTSTAALLGHMVPDANYCTAALATDAILILSKGCEAASTIADALANAGMTASLATLDKVESGVRSGDIAVVVTTGAALRSLDIDALVAALAAQPPGLETMIIGVDADGDDLAQRLAQIDAVTTFVPIAPLTAATMAIPVVRAALRARRRQRDCYAYAKRCAAAELATRRLAENFDARVEQRVEQVVAAQEVGAFAGDRLSDSDERNRAVLELTDLILFTTDADGTLIKIDDRFFAVTGFARDRSMSIGSDKPGVYPDDRERVRAAQAAARDAGTPVDYVYRGLVADGSYRWWQVRARPVFNARGVILRWNGILADIHDRKVAEEQLRESEDRHRFCIGLSKLVTYTATTDAIIDSVDTAISTATGIDTAHIIGRLPTSFCHPDDVAGLRDALLSARRRDIFDHSYRIRDANGDYRWYRSCAQPRRDEAGNVVRWYGTLEDIDDLRRAEERLRESEELHRHAVELSNLIVWTATPKGRFISISPRIFKILGLTREMTPSLRPLSLVHPDDLPTATAALQAGLGDGVAADFGIRLRIADGSYRWWRLRSSPLRDGDGAIVRWYGTFDDVDELTRSEERLRESEELHRFSVELSNQVVWTGTPEGRLLSVGPNLLEKLGLTSVQWLQQQPEQRVHPDDLEAANMALRHAVTVGVPANFQCRLLHGDGDYHWWRIRAAPRRGVDGAIIRWYGTLEDVNEFKRAGERLRETEERYRYTVELSEQIVFTASATGKITSIGARWTQVSGQSADAVLGDGIFAFIHPDDRTDVANRWTLRVADGLGADLVCRIADASGEYRWWRIRAAQRQGASGDVIGWYGTVEDISDATRSELKLKQMQAELAHMARLNAMGAMASTLAHELNQPLAAVVNYIAGSMRLLDGTTGPAVHKIQYSMRSAQDCAYQAGEIIRRVRNQLSRGDSRQSVVMAELLVKDACNVALINARELGINLVVDLDPAMTCVFGDDIQFQQILINLLRNAADAVSGRADRQIVISTRRVGSYLAFAVDDSGPGVAKGMEARLFEPFESSKPDGMGIGLSISRTIAEAHGGRLEYEPSVLGGARFTILLPSSAEPEHRA